MILLIRLTFGNAIGSVVDTLHEPMLLSSLSNDLASSILSPSIVKAAVLTLYTAT
jgi:hypothetical protein